MAMGQGSGTPFQPQDQSVQEQDPASKKSESYLGISSRLPRSLSIQGLGSEVGKGSKQPGASRPGSSAAAPPTTGRVRSPRSLAGSRQDCACAGLAGRPKGEACPTPAHSEQDGGGGGPAGLGCCGPCRRVAQAVGDKSRAPGRDASGFSQQSGNGAAHSLGRSGDRCPAEPVGPPPVAALGLSPGGGRPSPRPLRAPSWGGLCAAWPQAWDPVPESLRRVGLQSLAVETQRKSYFYIYLFFHLYC